MAGASGFEPELKVLETFVLTVDTMPLEISHWGYFTVLRC